MKVDKSKWEKTTLEKLCTCGSSDVVISKTNIGVGEYSLYGASGYIGNVDFYHNEKAYLGLVKDGSGVGRVDKYPANSSLVGTMQYLYPTHFANIDFLKYLIAHLNLAKYVKGAAIPHIYYRHYKLEKVYLPPISEQEGIARELDSLQGVIDGYKAQLADLDSLAQSIFYEMFGDPITNERGWEKDTIEKITYKTKNVNWSKNDNEYFYIDLTSVDKEIKKIVETSIISASNAPSRAKQIVHCGDVIFATTRPTQMRSTIITDKYDLQICSTGYCVLRPNMSYINSYVLFYYLQTDEFKKYLSLRESGAAYPAVTNSVILDYIIPLPPLQLQQQFAERVEEIEAQKELIKAQLADAEMLMAERMQYYFS